MTRGHRTDAERYVRLLAAIDASPEQRLHCAEAAKVLGVTKPNLGARVLWAIENNLLHRQDEGRTTYYARGPAPNAPLVGVRDFQACLCSDGELHLYGLPEANDDGSVTLCDAQRRALAAVLVGDPAGESFLSGREPIEAMLWSDGELVLWHLPPPDEESGAVMLSNAERRLLRALLVKP